MQVLSVNCALPKTVEINRKPVLTGIYKQPVDGIVRVGALTLEGDDQADKRFHGGPDQVVYCYAANHYAHWQAYLKVPNLPYGTFGENLTLSDMDENTVYIGDVLQIGEVQLQVTKPRIPCYKLGHKLGSKTVIKDFLHSGYSGFYCRVLQQGSLHAGLPVEMISRDAQGVSVKTALALQKLDLKLQPEAEALLTQVLNITSLTKELKEAYTNRLARLKNRQLFE